jgi:4-phytase/acid phosphatase
MPRQSFPPAAFLVAAAAVVFAVPSSAQAQAQAQAQTTPPSDLKLVVIVTRHGVRSPTDPTELNAYSKQPWPAWSVQPGYLTPHGAQLMSAFGAAYRAFYAGAGLFAASGCPPRDAVYVWADVDERTQATASALLQGFGPGCGLTAHVSAANVDPLFHALPSLGSANQQTSLASVTGALGQNPQAIVAAYRSAFAQLDALLGCGDGSCSSISAAPSAVSVNGKSGIASLDGPVDLASTAVEDLILEYADGRPAAEVGWGHVDGQTLLELSQLHVLKFALGAETPYNARVQGSNLLAHVLATIDQGATGKPNAATRAPLESRFVAFVGHDTNLAELAGLLRLHWLLPGYQLDDTPPGGALVFEVHAGAGASATVRTYYTAQSLDQMRAGATAPPARVPVYVPGCPSFNCPLATFDAVVARALDPAFVAPW